MIRALLLATLSTAPAAPQAKPALPAPPPDAQCRSLGKPRLPASFGPGEALEYEVDALGAKAGKLEFRVLPRKDGRLQVEAQVQSNTFFEKVRKVTARALSTLDARTLRPVSYEERSTEDGTVLTADVDFSQDKRTAALQFSVDGKQGTRSFGFASDGLDVVGALYLLRQVPLQQGQPLCFDTYGVRRMWRVFGTVQGREHLSTKIGEFEAWHITGWAVRLDNPHHRRELHVWISDDAARLPLVALGVIDLGAVRATLVGHGRPGQARRRAERNDSLKW
ncbi:MAG: hypothetical protein RL653_3744 [Pseudomonadota bacterium]|jgi:hypothetical protein